MCVMPSTPKLTVYISSTSEDLKHHRAEVAKAIDKLGDDPLGMESYAAESRNPIEKCLTDVGKCDVYVLLLARRYGYRPHLEGPSVTHLEFQEAERTQKEILAFLLHESVGDWPAQFEDADPSDINAFRDEVSKNYLRDNFNETPMSAAYVVCQSLGVAKHKRQLRALEEQRRVLDGQRRAMERLWRMFYRLMMTIMTLALVVTGYLYRDAEVRDAVHEISYVATTPGEDLATADLEWFAQFCDETFWSESIGRRMFGSAIVSQSIQTALTRHDANNPLANTYFSLLTRLLYCSHPREVEKTLVNQWSLVELNRQLPTNWQLLLSSYNDLGIEFPNKNADTIHNCAVKLINDATPSRERRLTLQYLRDAAGNAESDWKASLPQQDSKLAAFCVFFAPTIDEIIASDLTIEKKEALAAYGDISPNSATLAMVAKLSESATSIQLWDVIAKRLWAETHPALRFDQLAQFVSNKGPRLDVNSYPRYDLARLATVTAIGQPDECAACLSRVLPSETAVNAFLASATPLSSRFTNVPDDRSKELAERVLAYCTRPSRRGRPQLAVRKLGTRLAVLSCYSDIAAVVPNAIDDSADTNSWPDNFITDIKAFAKLISFLTTATVEDLEELNPMLEEFGKRQVEDSQSDKYHEKAILPVLELLQLQGLCDQVSIGVAQQLCLALVEAGDRVDILQNSNCREATACLAKLAAAEREEVVCDQIRDTIEDMNAHQARSLREIQIAQKCPLTHEDLKKTMEPLNGTSRSYNEFLEHAAAQAVLLHQSGSEVVNTLLTAINDDAREKHVLEFTYVHAHLPEAEPLEFDASVKWLKRVLLDWQNENSQGRVDISQLVSVVLKKERVGPQFVRLLPRHYRETSLNTPDGER